MRGKEHTSEFIGMLIGILLAGLLFGLASCRTTVRYVPVETVRIDSVRLNTARIDSVFVHDSSAVVIKGDSVIEYQYRYIYKYKGATDTAYINRTDTIRVPYPVEIEKRLTTWQRVKVHFGGWAIAGIILIILIVFRKACLSHLMK